LSSSNGSFRLPIWSGLFAAKHRRRMQKALWTFGVLVDWQTTPEGWVWGGKPIPAGTIAERLGISVAQAQRDLKLLAREDYVQVVLKSGGYCVQILRQKKFEAVDNRDRNADHPRKDADHGDKSADHERKNAFHTARARSDSSPDSTPTQESRQLSLFDPQKKKPRRAAAGDERRRTVGVCQCGFKGRPVWVDGGGNPVAVENCPRCYRRGHELGRTGT